MSTIYVSMPPPGPTADKSDTQVTFAPAQPVSPLVAQWHSEPEIFTQFAQQTTGTATIT